MKLTPKARKQVRVLQDAYAKVDLVLQGWPDTHRFKEHALDTLSSKREALSHYMREGNATAIERLPVPVAMGTNVVWQVSQ